MSGCRIRVMGSQRRSGGGLAREPGRLRCVVTARKSICKGASYANADVDRAGVKFVGGNEWLAGDGIARPLVGKRPAGPPIKLVSHQYSSRRRTRHISRRVLMSFATRPDEKKTPPTPG